MINFENVSKMYETSGVLKPDKPHDKRTTKPEKRIFNEPTKAAIIACLTYGKGQLIKTIARRINKSETHTARYCRYMDNNKLIKSQLADDTYPYGVKCYYLIDDDNLPLTKDLRNEQTILKIVSEHDGILKSDIRKLAKISDYATQKALTALDDKKKIKACNIAGQTAGSRCIYSWSLR